MHIKEQVLYGKTLRTDTIYIGHDNIEYEATAELVIENDGTYRISKYDYFDHISSEWRETEDRDWDRNSIEKTFGIEISD